MFLELAPGQGFEPRLSGSEPDVLPLHHPGIFIELVVDPGIEPELHGYRPRVLPLN
jgi:hypothetical protein